jgi:hypothetical protein
MQVIIWTNEAGNVSVCYPTSELPIEEVLAKDAPPSAVVVDAGVLPLDRDFFDAWRLNAGVVAVSLDAAKEITRTRLRTERAPLLQALDVQFQRALETGADTAPIVAEKQRLRDITKLADSCDTLDALRSLHC